MTIDTTSEIGENSILTLIDGSGYIFRAFYAIKGLNRKSDGLPVNAVSGFCNMLYKFLADGKNNGDTPTHLAVIFDASSKTFRNEIYPEYKAQRPPPPEDLIPQFPLIREATRAFGVPAIEMLGFEADDLIATYAKMATEKGAKVRIVSSDKDLMQLVGGNIELYDPMKDKPLGLDAVNDKFGVTPDKVIDVQALAGDSSDNVPGAPGIGIKTAAELINTFGSLEELLNRAEEIKQPKRRETLINFREQIEVSKKLVTLKDDVPDVIPLNEFRVKEPDAAVLMKFLEEMEFSQLTSRVRKHLDIEGHIADNAMVGEIASDTPKNSVNRTNHNPIKIEKFETISDLDRLKEILEIGKSQGYIAIDTETDALDNVGGNLVGVCLSIGENKSYYVPLAHVSAADSLFAEKLDGQPDFDKTIRLLKPYFEDAAILKIGHNLKYDWAILKKYGIETAPLDDTMLISFVLDSGKERQGHGLDELSILHLDHRAIAFKDVCGTGKAQITFDQVQISDATKYAAEDAEITLRLWKLLKPRLVHERVTRVYENIERPLVAPIAKMEMAGIKVDLNELNRLSQDFGARMAEYEQQAYSLAGETFNVQSPKQLGEIFYEKMGLSGGKKTKSGQWQVDSDVLDQLAANGQELATTILEYRTLAKLKSTYTDSLKAAIKPQTGRVHTSFNMVGAITGRLSSTDPNLQNIPIRTEEGRKIRHCFISEAGKSLISADYSQIELRLLAHVGDIPQLKQAFIDKLDIHAATASEMFNVPMAEMTSEIRRRAKAINFGIIYGQSAWAFARQLGISQAQAKDYIETYFARFPGIKQYMEEKKEFARKNGYAETLFGRRIYLEGINSKGGAERAYAERQSINAPLQGAAADIIKRAMARLDEVLKTNNLGVKMLLQVHDELIFEVPENNAQDAIEIIKPIMEKAALPAVDLSVPLVVEAGIGKNWNDAH